MPHARRRMLRCTVLAASVAVLASFVVAPAARAEAPATTTAEATTSAESGSTEPISMVPAPATADPGDPGATSGPAPTSATPEPAPEPTPEPTPAPSTATDPAEVASGDTVVGELVQAWPDPTADEHAHEDHDHAAEEPLSWIEPTEGDAVRVPTDSLPDVAVGSTLAVTVGDEIVDEAAAEQGFEPAVEVQAATVLDAAAPDPTTASAGTAPTNTVTAVLVLPAGATSDGMTIGTVLSTLGGGVSSFWDEQSNSTVRIAAVQGAAGWVRSSQTCANPYALWDDVAAQISWTGGPGKHLMLYVPSNAAGCAYGLGTVGSSIGTGGRSYVRAAAVSVMAHELGHNFGLGHSSESQCDNTVETGTCRVADYRDYYDVMGFSWTQVGTLNVAQAARLGLLPAGERVTMTTSSAATTVTLAPVSAASGTRAVVLTDAAGAVYYLEYRQASGQDAWLAGAGNTVRLDAGVVLRRAGAGSNTSLLLDGTPSPSSGWDADLQQALPLGTTVSLASGDLALTVQGITPGGATVRIAPRETPISVAYASLGGASGRLGAALAAESCGLRDGGCYRPYRNGLLYWSPGSGAQVIAGDTGGAWLARGAQNSVLGYPVAAQVCGLAAGGCLQQFQGGRVYWSPSSGAAVAANAFIGAYEQFSAQDGVLGYPVADSVCGLRDGGCAQPFRNGWLVSAPGSGAQVIAGDTGGAWLARGAQNSVLGYPVAAQVCGLAAGGCLQQFQGGRVYWSPSSGAAVVVHAVIGGYEQFSAQDGVLGYPVADSVCGLRDGGCAQPFQNGWVVGSASSGAHRVLGDVGAGWFARGAQNGLLGFPIGELVCGLAAQGCLQDFQGGRLYWTPGTGAHLVRGSILTAYERSASQDGELGYPVADEACSGARCTSTFQHGTIVWSPAGVAVTR